MYSYFQHQNAVCMTYFEHMRLSLGFSATLFIGSFKAIVHAFLPNYFITSTTDVWKQIGQELKEAGCHDNIDSTPTLPSDPTARILS
jgi:hypothetical protein